MTSYIYTFVRKDISYEQRIVQIGHACYEAGKIFQDNVGISNLILLSAEDGEDLINIANEIQEFGIDFFIFFEPDNDMEYSAICTRPVISTEEREFFRKWPLYRHI